MAVKLTFTGGLEYNKTYTVTLAAGAPSANGVPTVTEYTTTFTTAKGKKLYVSDIAVAGNTATVSLSNLTTQLQSAVLVVCAYKADGEFAGVKYTDVTFTSGEEISPSVTFDSLEGVESITAFLWESNSSLCPVEKGFTKNI